MSRSRLAITPAVEQAIVAYIRAGSFAHVAAEAAGVPRAVFDDWMARGERPRAATVYRAFARAVRQAEGQARVAAEIEVRKDKPLDWLKSGPGRQLPGRPGWTGPAKAADPRPAETSWLLDARGQVLFAELLEALAGHPEARAVAGETLGRVIRS